MEAAMQKRFSMEERYGSHSKQAPQTSKGNGKWQHTGYGHGAKGKGSTRDTGTGQRGGGHRTKGATTLYELLTSVADLSCLLTGRALVQRVKGVLFQLG